MRRRLSQRVILGAPLAILLAAQSQALLAGQSEPSVTCDEGAEPTLLTYGVHTIGCEITPTTDLDRFEFDAAVGDQVRIIVDGQSNYFDPRIELRGPDGTVLRDEYCTGGTTFTCMVTVEETLPTAGTYQVAVSDSGADDTGNYQLQLERLWPTAAAIALPYNSPMADVISPTTDMDFYEFAGAAGTDIRIIVDGQSNYFDPRIELRGPDGTVLRDEYCTGGTTFTCTVTVEETLPTAGTYQVAVSDSGADDTGNYNISLQCLFGSCPSSVPTRPQCHVELESDLYLLGDDVFASVLRFENPGSEAVAVEFKWWLEAYGLELPFFSLGADGSFVLPPGFSHEFGPFKLFTVSSGIPAGWYSFNCRFVSPVSGRQLSFGQDWFEVQ